MGIVKNIGIKEFPKQGSWVGWRTRVCFRYDASQTLRGTVVRDDYEEPWVTIIRLDDGRFVLASECMHSPEAPKFAGEAGTPEDPQ